ncbi:hypothetical protein [Pelagibius sp.]|uniref:hypothetical protein n=1 Tax=Pelagibius sp. TaxID=1931238 RepID=UPI003B50129E
MADHRLSFANFICRFGESGEMLDYLEEIVLPAFTDDTMVRTYGETTEYFLLNSKLEILEQKKQLVLAIAGQFVKDTSLRRTQIFEEGKGLRQDEAEIQSSPSAFFVLILNNHKLLYLPETPHAPDVKAFSSTIGSFLRAKHKKYIDELYQAGKATAEKISKKALREEHPKPSLVVVPLASRSSIDDFLHQYKTLRLVELTLLRPNQEIQGGEWWQQLRDKNHAIGAEKTKIVHRNPKGLQADEASKEIHDAAAAGNQTVKLDGKDRQGNILRGNNESFRYSVPIETLPVDRSKRIKLIYEKFKRLVQSKTITLDASSANADTVLRRLRDLFGD